MRFRIVHFLVVTLLCVFGLLPLARPSVWWLLLLPAFLCLLAIYCTARVVVSPTTGRVFWAAFPIGVLIYLAAVALVAQLWPTRNRAVEQSVWDDFVGRPMWRMVHGDSAFITNQRGFLNEDFVSFLAWTHVVIAMTLSSIAALVAQVIVLWRSLRATPVRHPA